MRIIFNLDPEATGRLIDRAIRNRRPIHMEAEVIVLESLGFTLPRPAFEAQNEPGEVRR